MPVRAPYATPNGRWVLKVLGLAGLELAPGATPARGWIAGYDPEAAGGLGEVQLTEDLEAAARWPSPVEAVQCIHTQPTSRPLRPDGKPNRPLTAYHLQLLTIELARTEGT